MIEVEIETGEGKEHMIGRAGRGGEERMKGEGEM